MSKPLIIKNLQEIPGSSILSPFRNPISLLTPKGWGYWEGCFETLWFDKSLLILNGNFNKNYQLPL